MALGHWLKGYLNEGSGNSGGGDSGSGSGGPLVVHLNFSKIADKTFREIGEALSSGRGAVVHVAGIIGDSVSAYPIFFAPTTSAGGIFPAYPIVSYYDFDQNKKVSSKSQENLTPDSYPAFTGGVD